MAILLPYTFKITSRSVVNTNTAILHVQIFDAPGLSLRRETDVHVSVDAPWREVIAAVDEQIDQAMVTDAGSRALFQNQIVSDALPFQAQAIVGKRKSADQATTSASFVDCADLAFTLAPSTHYKFSFLGGYTAAAGTTGLQLSVNGPASPAFMSFIGQIHTAAGTVLGGAGGTYDGGTVNGTASGGATALPFKLDGTISTGATGGAFALRFRTEINASAVTILRGSVGELIAVG